MPIRQTSLTPKGCKRWPGVLLIRPVMPMVSPLAKMDCPRTGVDERNAMNQPQEATLTRATKVLIDLKQFDLASKLMELMAESPNDSPSLTVISSPEPVDGEI